jgi:ABC-type nitrate/sulfonate/bicarbonate transport system permease component
VTQLSTESVASTSLIKAPQAAASLSDSVTLAGSEDALRVQARRQRRGRENHIVRAWQIGIVVFGLVLMWAINAGQGDLVMPRPDHVVTSFWDMINDGSLWTALRQSLKVFLVGFATAAVAGVIFGILVGGFHRVGKVFEPFINALNSTPRVAFIPLIIVWFGLDTTAKIVVTWLSAVIPILINTAAGMENADHDLSEMARSMGASRRQLFWRVLIPGAVPMILTGLRIGSALAILGTVVSELYTAESGLGGLLVESSNHFEMAQYFAVVFVLMAIGVLISTLLRALERRFMRWRPGPREGA